MSWKNSKKHVPQRVCWPTLCGPPNWQTYPLVMYFRFKLSMEIAYLAIRLQSWHPFLKAKKLANIPPSNLVGHVGLFRGLWISSKSMGYRLLRRRLIGELYAYGHVFFKRWISHVPSLHLFFQCCSFYCSKFRLLTCLSVWCFCSSVINCSYAQCFDASFVQVLNFTF